MFGHPAFLLRLFEVVKDNQAVLAHFLVRSVDKDKIVLSYPASCVPSLSVPILIVPPCGEIPLWMLLDDVGCCWMRMDAAA